MTQDADEYSLGTTDSDAESLSDADFSDLEASEGEDDMYAEDFKDEEPEREPGELADSSDDEKPLRKAPPKPKAKPGPAAGPGRAVNGAGMGKDNIVGKRLKPPTVTQYSTRFLFNQIKDGDISLDAEYQRDVVWPEKNQSRLIDSVIRHYYIPPVVFCSSSHEDGNEVKVCVDGKQRLTSIYKFMNGEIPYIAKNTGIKYFWTLSGKKRTAKWEEFPAFWKDEFLRCQITTVEFLDLQPSEERDIFQRVQLGMALSTPEKWQALQGPWPDFLRELRASYFNDLRRETNILAYINWDNSRAKDFQDLVRMAFMVNNTVVTDGQILTSTDKLEDALHDEDGPSDRFKVQFTTILSSFLKLVKDSQYSRAFTGKVAPVELVMIAVLIGKYMNNVSESTLADGIAAMRKDIRGTVAKGYVMWKPEIVKKMLIFIDNWRPESITRPGKAKAKPPKPKPPVKAAKPAPVKKRKVESESESDSSDDMPLRRNVRVKTEPGSSKGTPSSQARPVKPPVRPSMNGSGPSTIGRTNVPAPQRVEPPPMVSRQALLNRDGVRPVANGNPVDRPRSSLPSFKKETKETKPPVDVRAVITNPAVVNPVVTAPTVEDKQTVVDIQSEIDILSQEITALQELFNQENRTDKAEISAKLRDKQNRKSKLQTDKFLKSAFGQSYNGSRFAGPSGGSSQRPFGAPTGPLG